MSSDPEVGTRSLASLWSVAKGRIENRPLAWRTDSGQRPSDEWLAAQGFYAYVDAPPTYDRDAARLVRGNVVVDHAARTATVAYSTEPLPREELVSRIDAERDRRIHGGFVFNGVRFQTRLEDQKRIAGAGTLALAAIVAGAQPGDLRWHGGGSGFTWIGEGNSLNLMDAHAVLAFGQAAAAWESAHVFAARALKDAETIPADYLDDLHWPGAS